MNWVPVQGSATPDLKDACLPASNTFGQETFPGKFDKATPEMLFRAANVVQDPSFIRVESDEVGLWRLALSCSWSTPLARCQD